MNDSAKATNSEIVKSLVVLVQDFINATYGDQVQGRSGMPIDQDNLVSQIGHIMSEHRRQKDRIEDVMANMARIVKGG